MAIARVGRYFGRRSDHEQAAWRVTLQPGVRFATSLVAAALVASVAAAPALGAGTVSLTTPYPAVAVQQDKTASFDLSVTSSVRQRVDLSVVDVPSGWTASLHGGGFVIDGVIAGPGLNPEVKLDVAVPPDAAEGRYRVVVRANGGGTVSNLSLDLRVAASAGGKVSMSTENPALRDTADKTFTYTVNLKNDTPQDLTFSLTATGPTGWDVTATPSGQTQAASFVVEGGLSSTITVTAKPTTDAAADTYPIKVTATAGEQTASIDLQAQVIGKVDMQLTTPDQRLSANATAGSTKDVQLVVNNQGSAQLNDVAITSSAPNGWDVKIDPATVPSIAANGSQTVTAHITPAGSAIAGDYMVTFTARAGDGGDSQDINMRVTVDTALSWGLIGIALILLTLVGLGWVFQRYGRR